MKLGVSTSVYLHNELKTAIKEIGELNFEYIEIWGEPPHLWSESIDYKYLEEIKLLINQYNLIPTYHAPAHDIDLTSINPGIRNESIKQHFRALEICKYLDVKVLVTHAGSYYPGDKEGSENGKDRLYKSLNKLLSKAEKLNIILAVENYPVNINGIFNNPKTMKEVISYYDSSYLKATLDIGHANLTDILVLNYIEILKEDIVHLHLNDNMGKEDEHLIPGEGNLDLNPIIKRLNKIGFEGAGIFEIWAPKDPKNALIKCKNLINSI